jgi:uncharacterized membrane protein
MKPKPSGAWLIIPLLLLTAGQLSAAASGRAISAGAGGINIYTLLTYLFFGLRGLSWVLIVRYFQLSAAYPVMSLGFCLVPPAAALFFGDPLSISTVIGMVLVTVGVFLAAVEGGSF